MCLPPDLQTHAPYRWLSRTRIRSRSDGCDLVALLRGPYEVHSCGKDANDEVAEDGSPSQSGIIGTKVEFADCRAHALAERQIVAREGETHACPSRRN